jgi:nucleoid-associated protein YgaU
LKALIGIEPPKPAPGVETAGNVDRDAEKQRDADLKRQIEARQAEQKLDAERQRLAAEAKRVSELTDAATRQRQKSAEAARIAVEERSKAIPHGGVASADQVASLPPKTAGQQGKEPVVKGAKGAGDGTGIAQAEVPAAAGTTAPARPAAAPPPANSQPPASPSKQARNADERPADKAAASRMAEAASKAMTKALDRSNKGQRARTHVAAHVSDQEGSAKTAKRRSSAKSKGDRCARAGEDVEIPAIYVVKRGDTLWDIARRHYNKGSRFEKIFKANEAKIADPDLIFPCQKFFLPGRSALNWAIPPGGSDAS